MSENDKPRSAVEIAMERMRQKDAERGVVSRPPTEAQKAEIAEARSVNAAKVAQLGIFQQSKLAGVFDPEERERLEAEFRDELRRLNDELDRRIQKIRGTAGN